jgi:hypothetical protein
MGFKADPIYLYNGIIGKIELWLQVYLARYSGF